MALGSSLLQSVFLYSRALKKQSLITLQYFLSFIGKDTKFKELEHADCENYYYHRHKASNGNGKQVTVQNEQGTINACINWL